MFCASFASAASAAETPTGENLTRIPPAYIPFAGGSAPGVLGAAIALRKATHEGRQRAGRVFPPPTTGPGEAPSMLCFPPSPVHVIVDSAFIRTVARATATATVVALALGIPSHHRSRRSLLLLRLLRLIAAAAPRAGLKLCVQPIKELPQLRHYRGQCPPDWRPRFTRFPPKPPPPLSPGQAPQAGEQTRPDLPEPSKQITQRRP